MKKSAVILSIVFALCLLSGVKGYVKLVTRGYETLTGTNKIEALEIAEEEGSNIETFILETSGKSVAETVFENASISDKIRHFQNAIQLYLNDVPLQNQIVKVNGGFQAMIGRDIIADADVGNDVIKLDNGYLVRLQSGGDADFVSKAAQIIDLNVFLTEKGIPLVFAHAPYKIEYSDIPLENKAKTNYQLLNDMLVNGGVKVIDIKAEMDRAGMDFFSSYYKTDHHWKAQTGLWCAGMLAQKFSNDYGFTYDESLLNPQNYTYEVLENFIGTQGKRVGTLYAGVDDFTIIHTKFETDLESDILLGNGEWECRSGTLENAMYGDNQSDTFDCFSDIKILPYSMYSNGNNPIQVIRNNKAKNDKKIIVVRHSFANVTMPFLSLAFREINVVDLRAPNRPDNLYSYIEEYQPDFVLFLW